MGRLVIIILCGLWLNASAVELTPQHPNTYVVKSGDTLWGIAGKFLKNPWDWLKVWHGNPGLNNPNYLYPGDVLMLHIDEHGQPQIVLTKQPTNNTLKLSPRVRLSTLEQAIMTIPLSSVMPFLSRTRLVTDENYAAAPYVLALTNDERVAAGTLEDIFVRNLKGPEPRTYNVYRKNNVYIDPKTKKILGYQGLFIAEVQLKHYADPATFKIVSSKRELLLDDRLYPEEHILPPYFLPTPATLGLVGTIIGVDGGVEQIGQYNIVALNLGTNAGVAPGYVFSITKEGRTLRDNHGPEPVLVTLPSYEAGVLMVFKTYKTLSYALIMRTAEPIQIGDRVTAPQD